jgi:hypothetical protein
MLALAILLIITAPCAANCYAMMAGAAAIGIMILAGCIGLIVLVFWGIAAALKRMHGRYSN